MENSEVFGVVVLLLIGLTFVIFNWLVAIFRIRKRRQLDRKVVCPYCHRVGMVRTAGIVKKVGVSGGKATAAILTSGLSLLLFGLSRKENYISAYCSNCGIRFQI